MREGPPGLSGAGPRPPCSALARPGSSRYFFLLNDGHGSLLPPPASPLPHGPVSARLKISKMQICSCHFSASDILMTPHCLESNSNSSS